MCCNAVLLCLRRMITELSRSFSITGEVRRATEVASRVVRGGQWTGTKLTALVDAGWCRFLTLCGRPCTWWLGLGRMLETSSW